MQENVALSMTGITKQFPGVLALDDVSLRVLRGEVHALLGENGAGKSTLMKILAGAYQKDSGEIEVFSKKVEIDTPKSAEDLGIVIIYQELNLIPGLTVAENIFMGHHKMKNKFQIDWNQMNQKASQLLKNLEVDVQAHDYVKNLGIAQQQMVEITRALSVNAKIIIMDEPTAPLTERETKNLFKMIGKLKENGVSVIYISHRLEEVEQICDRATIMRDGKTITEINVADVTIDDIIKHMVGRELKEKFPRIEKTIGKEIFRVENLCSGSKVQHINFGINAGEVLCIGGLVGAGRTETARAIFGLEHLTEGKIYIEGKECKIRNPRDAIELGIGFVTEDRKGEGLVLMLGVGDNITLASLKNFSNRFHLDLKKEQKTVEEYIDKLNIKTPSSQQRVRNLSGGNQQKIVLAKWMLSKCKVLIFDEPTRGIDVGAKIEVYNIINELAKAGKAIMVITSEIPELLGICDRILVMARGRVSGELKREEATQEGIMTYATGIDLAKEAI